MKQLLTSHPSQIAHQASYVRFDDTPIMENFTTSGARFEPYVDILDNSITSKPLGQKINKKNDKAILAQSTHAIASPFMVGAMACSLLFSTSTVGKPISAHSYYVAKNYLPLNIAPEIGTTEAKDDKLTIFYNKIEKFIKLPLNWDGEDGIAPSPKSGDDARCFLKILSLNNLPIESHAVGDGEILFQWKNENSFIEAAFNGETVSWYARIENEAAIHGDDNFEISKIDPRLLNAISKFS